MASWRWLTDGGVTSPRGVMAGAAACGLKASRSLDLALLSSEKDCCAAGVFTRNQVVAAPVTLDREVLSRSPDAIRAVVANAGNANACTGAKGLADAREMQRLTAEAVGCEPDQVLVLSTGVIGQPLDMAAIRRGIRDAAGRLSPGGGSELARAIMTTDTRPKEAAMEVPLGGGSITLGGVAKGAGMIHPDMATMLSVMVTDAALGSSDLSRMLTAAVQRSFNRISVDGDTSTNDTVLLLANGASKIEPRGEDLQRLQEALDRMSRHLARAIVRDGEGATRFVTLRVTGAASEADALQVARTVATSSLVKTAFAGGDPNWGRILAAAGRAGVKISPARLDLSIATSARRVPAGEEAPEGDVIRVQLVGAGLPTAYLEDEAEAVFAAPEFRVDIHLGVGSGEAEVWTTDLTHDYVTINADYRT